jgi:hypothetical protein
VTDEYFIKHLHDNLVEDDRKASPDVHDRNNTVHDDRKSSPEVNDRNNLVEDDGKFWSEVDDRKPPPPKAAIQVFMRSPEATTLTEFLDPSTSVQFDSNHTVVAKVASPTVKNTMNSEENIGAIPYSCSVEILSSSDSLTCENSSQYDK